ncbi:MAG: hypothetical protein K0S09_1707 [Sphingobacteriaceae bacterium]|jgi:hypothetical protein|nr:hypothetical protein [Sphingobacteriaceae bacterium]
MKKITLIALLLTLGVTAAFAQSFNLGIKGGLNLAKLQSNLTSEENRLGFQVGAWARIGAVGFYVQPELYLGSKGSNFTSIVQQNGTEVSQEEKVSFTTLDLPVLVGTKIGVSNLNVRFMGGPVVSFILDKENPTSGAYQSITDFHNYKNNALGLQAGAGIDISKLSIDLRYEAGLTNVSKSDKYEQKSNLWHLSLGYKIL